MAAIINYLHNHLVTAQTNYETLDPVVQRVMVKEVLQSYVLDYIYNHAQYKQLVFYGGTCARMVYGLNRMSEDLDLDNSVQVNLDNFAQDLEQHFSGRLGLMGVTVKAQGLQTGNIERFTLKLPILKELGLSPLADEKLHVKLEVSLHQQQFQQLVTPIAQHNCSFVVNHFNQPSLFAGKILACLERSWQQGKSNIQVKGRDYYDLIWYMKQQVMPWERKLRLDGQQSYTVDTAFEALEEKMARISQQDLRRDLVSLFKNKDFINNWLEHFHDFFDRYKQFYLQKG